MTILRLPNRSDILRAADLLQQKGIFSEIQRQDNILLKLDAKLPGGSYKIRGVEVFTERCKSKKVDVLSAGNLALASAISFKKNGIICQALVPEGISDIKREKLESIGADINEKSFTQIWDLVQRNELRHAKNFLHPLNKNLLAGYATIILEMQQAGLDNATLVVPYGLGGLASALANAIEIFKSHIKLVICEIAGHAPFLRARMESQPVVGNKLQSFIEAMGTPVVLEDVFTYLNERIDKIIQVTEEEVKEEINLALLLGTRIEGASGAAIAAAKKLSQSAPVVALLTGANISEEVLHSITHHRMHHTQH